MHVPQLMAMQLCQGVRADNYNAAMKRVGNAAHTLYNKLYFKWAARMTSEAPPYLIHMAECLDLREMVKDPCPLDLAKVKENLEVLTKWARHSGISIADDATIWQEWCTLKQRLAIAAKRYFS